MTVTAFARVNGGVDFGNEVFHPADANGLRTNAELQWVNEITRFSRASVDVTDLGVQYTSAVGPLAWHPYYGCYLAATKNGGIGQVLVTAGPASPALVTELPYASSIPTGSYAPTIFGALTAHVYQAVQTATTTTTVYASADISSWTSAATATFVPSAVAAPAYAYGQTILAGSGTAGVGALLVLTPNSMSVVAKACPATFTGAIESVATDGATAVGVASAAAYGKEAPLSGSGTGTDVTINVTGQASPSGLRVAYDSRLGKWVLMANGAIGYRGYLYWCAQTSADWTSGSWRRVAIPVTGFDVSMTDFTVTQDGVWLAVIATAPVSGYRQLVIMASIDGGANWSRHDVGLFRNAAGAPAAAQRFSASAGPYVSILSRPSATTLDILTSGQINNGTTVASTAV